MTDNLDIKVWLEFALADLDTAKLVLLNSKNYHISVYHSHQSIEKILKRKYLTLEKKYEFIHDIVQLLLKLDEKVLFDKSEYFIDKAIFMMRLYNDTRYPKGDSISFEDAKIAVAIAEEFVSFFR